MNNDCQLIFEAYLKSKQRLTEAPIYGTDDLGYTGDIESAPGRGYGIGKAAQREGKSKAEIANALLDIIKKKLFKPVPHTIDGKEYQLFYPGSKMKFRTELEHLIKSELKLGGTEAKYTARVVDNLLNVLRVDAEGGVASTPAAVKNAVTAGIQNKPVVSQNTAAHTTAQPAQANTYVKTFAKFIPEFAKIFSELPDEITPAKSEDFYDSNEFKEEVKNAIIKVYDVNKANDKELVADFISSVKHKNGYIPSSEAAQKEGEGSGEAPTVDEYPEDDDATSELRNMGSLPTRYGMDQGNFSYGD